MIAVLSALEPEIQGIIAGLSIKGSETWAGRIFYHGTLGSTGVIAGFTGVGKSLAAMVTQRVIDAHSPDAIVYLGIAGALNSELDLGDVVIGEQAIQHDMDATSFGFDPGEIPHEGIITVDSNAVLVAKASEWKPENRTVTTGLIASGDRYVLTAEKAILRERFGADAVEMEGASAGLVATVNSVPFLLVRVVSDTASGDTPGSFKAFVKESSVALLGLLRHLVGAGAFP